MICARVERTIDPPIRKAAMRLSKKILQCAFTFVFLLVVLALPATNTYAFSGIEIDAFFGYASPQGEFAKTFSQPALGGGIDARFALGPFALGIGFMGLSYASDERKEPLSPTIPDFIVDVTTTHKVGQIYLPLRFTPRLGPFGLYIEGLVGWGSFTTETKIVDPNKDAKVTTVDEEGNQTTKTDNNVIASTQNHKDSTWFYGAGAGLAIRIITGVEGDRLSRAKKRKQNKNRKPGYKPSVWIDVGARYLTGGDVSYIKPGSRTQDGKPSYETLRSTTDMLIVKIALGFTL